MQLSILDIRKISLDVLKEIHQICIAEGIRYSLAYGTLIGAVRHKGFIPWDDDIDIMMSRVDYERFVQYCQNNETNFDLKTSETDAKYHYLFAKACSKKTIVKEKYGNKDNCEFGVYVDIFPIDFVGNTLSEARRNIKKMEFYRSILVSANWKKYFKSKSSKWYIEPIRFVFFLISRLVNIKNVENKINSFYKSKNKGRYSANAVDNTYGLKNIMPMETYSTFTTLQFEGNEFMAIKLYDKYLKSIYGDYMKLPPVEKQITHHTFEAYWK